MQPLRYGAEGAAVADVRRVLAGLGLLANVAWTPPTLAGTALYVRDRKTIAAFALGQ